MEGLPNELAHIVPPVPVAPGGAHKTRTLVVGRHGNSVGVAPLPKGADPPVVLVSLQAMSSFMECRLDYEEAVELSLALQGAASVIRQGNLTFWADEEGVEMEDDDAGT